MAEGHAGPHVVGSPYHPVERWVTQCPDDTCDYHENSDGSKNLWEECWKCGDRKPVGYSRRLKHYCYESDDGEVQITLSSLAMFEMHSQCSLPKTRVRMIWGKIKCQCHLLFGAMWRGETEFTAWDKTGRIALVASVTGSKFNYEVQRIFYAHGPLSTSRSSTSSASSSPSSGGGRSAQAGAAGSG
jgi:hypothetical protein